MPELGCLKASSKVHYMEDKLRKVKFNLSEINEQDLTVGDHETDKDGILEERQGWFHRWGDEVYIDPDTDKKFQQTVAIVEDETGRVYLVSPKTIIFVKR